MSIIRSVTDRRALVLLVLLHLAVVAAVQPRGDFPLNDDWAFAQSTRWLLDEGRLRLSDWVPMYLVPQTLAGGAAASLFGFSFEILRHVTQTVAVLALLAAFAWFRVAGLETRDALVASLALAAFPAWPVLANSFMTDVYALALALPAAACFARALSDPAPRWIVAATVLCVVGALERQVVLAIPFAFMVALLWTRKPLATRTVVAAIAPLAATAGAIYGFQAYLAAGPGVPELHRMAQGRVLAMARGAVENEPGLRQWMSSNLATIAAYLALFAMPWFAWWGVGGKGSRARAFVAGGGIAVLVVVSTWAWWPPYRENQVMDAAGIGPFMLYDTVRGVAPLDRSPGAFWTLLAVPAAFALAALAASVGLAVVRVWREGRAVDARIVFLLCLIGAYLAPFIVTDYFDRYLLFVLPFTIALAAVASPVRSSGPRLRLAALAGIALALVLSAAATRDYFAWNRARWDAIRLAEKLGGADDTIDGGFEHGGLKRYERRAPVPKGKSWYWVKDDRFAVTFTEMPGYEVVETWKLRPWLPRSPSEVMLLRRKP